MPSSGPVSAPSNPVLCVTFRRVVTPLRGPGQSPILPFACCVRSMRSVGSAAAACVPDGVVSTLAGPSGWRTGGCAGCCGGGLRSLLPTPRFRGHKVRRVAASLQPTILPSACCVGSLCSDGRCGLCSLWCPARGGVVRFSLTHTATRQGMWWTTCVWTGVGSNNRKTTPAATSATPACQLLGSVNAETTPPPASPRCHVREAQSLHPCVWCTWALHAPS